MGEYIIWQGETFKLGTCEDLYYVRFDDLVGMIEMDQAERDRGNLEPREYLGGAFRFRFPFPDEDQEEVGYHNRPFNRGVMIPWPAGVCDGAEHERVGVTAKPEGGDYAYTVQAALACPMDPAAPAGLWHGLTAGRRLLQLIQQRPIEGALWAVVRCPYCGGAWRLPPAEAAILAEAIDAENQPNEFDQAGNGSRAWYRELAGRIRAGYARDVAAELAALGGQSERG